LYVPANAPTTGAAQLLLETMLAVPGHSVALLPKGVAKAERLTETVVGSATSRRTVALWAITGVMTSPIPLWATTDNKFFAGIELPTVVPAGFVPAVIAEGFAGDADRLLTAQRAALAQRSARLAKSLTPQHSKTVVFRDVRALVEGRFVERQTITVRGSRIVHIGPAAAASIPSDALIVDGAGMTLVPGLWDYHHHVLDDSSGPFLLSLGVTSVRDPSNDNSHTADRERRRARSQLLFPNVYASALLDGPGPYSTNKRASWVNFGSVVDSQSEAVEAVRSASRAGLRGVKFYGSMQREWVIAAATEAHRLGLRVHGHLPAGVRPSQAIADGYDELTHAYFMMLEAMPDDIVNSSHTSNRFEGNGLLAKDVDLNATPMTTLIRQMAERRIAADPTLVIVEWLLTAVSGQVAPAYVPYLDSAPPMMQRRFRMGGVARKGSLNERSSSFARDRELVGAMHKAGIAIAAGTDGSGLELIRELEFYVAAGLTPTEALETATIVPARLMGVDHDTGSIAVGKAADLVLVDGDPSRNIGDLRHTRAVMLAGQLLDADALRAASAYSGRPH
jgi:hypothetical protein